MLRTTLRRFPINLLKTIRSLFYMMREDGIAYPYKLTMESTAICNLKCATCPQNYMKRKKGHLKFETFKKIYDEIRPPYLNLSGFGEPLMNPDLFKIIKYAKKRGSFIKVDTNGMLLNNKNISKLLNSGIDIISNSIDGMDKKTYEKIRIGANFEQVIKNLKKLVMARNKIKSKTEIHLYFVLQKSNFEQFPDFIRFGDSLGVDSISGCFVKQEGYKKNKQIGIEKIDKKKLYHLAEELKKLKKTIKANLEVDEIIDDIYNWEKKRGRIKSKFVPCYMCWYDPFITWDGIVAPCCLAAADKHIVIGDATKQHFNKIWNSEKMKKFRKMVATKRTGFCENCEVDESYIKEQFKKIPFYFLIKKK